MEHRDQFRVKGNFFFKGKLRYLRILKNALTDRLISKYLDRAANGRFHKLGYWRNLPINQVEVTMKVLEALAAAIAAEGIDRIFAVIGDANQEIIWAEFK